MLKEFNFEAKDVGNDKLPLVKRAGTRAFALMAVSQCRVDRFRNSVRQEQQREYLSLSGTRSQGKLI